MNPGQVVVAEARSWIGTPYHHQASEKGIGADCLGLVRGVWRQLLGQEPENPPPYTPDWDEVDKREVLLSAADRWLIGKPSAARVPGNVLLFRMRDDGPAKHLGIYAERDGTPQFIHAYSRYGVVETPLSQPWAKRVIAVFEFPAIGGR